MATSIEQKLRVAISEQLGIPEDEITADSTFAQDLGADSLDAVEIVMIAEEEFGIAIDEEQAEQLATFGDLCAYVQRLTTPKGKAGAKRATKTATKTKRRKA